MLCKQCSKEFIPHTNNQKFCSKEHRNRYFMDKLNSERKQKTLERKAQKLQVNFNKEDYKQNFKNHCVSCGKPIKVNWRWYLNYGNYCQECCVGAEKQSKKLNEPIKTLRKALVEIGAKK